MLIVALSLASVFIVIAGGLAILGVYKYKLYLRKTAKTQALHIAEAGVNYYRWHLAHAEEDFFDGTGSDPDGNPPNGPYQHTFNSPTGEIEGYFSLEITPPIVGSTITTIKSTGWTNDFPSIKRIIEVRYGIPSLAHYSFLTNSDVWFGNSENVSGEMHSNGGVRMDGTNDSLITSARDTYICGSGQNCDSSHCDSPCNWISGTGCECPGVWGSGPNSNLWHCPVPTVDFDAITMDIAQIKADAQSDGFYLNSSGGSNKGYHIIFQADGTFDIYIVNSLKSAIKQLDDDWNNWKWVAEEIKTETYDNNYPMPNNGLIFLEDDVWVEGTINGRATLVAADLPDNPNKRKTIYINNNINYLARDNNHILGLIAQKNIKVPRYAPTNLTIDAILLAQNGRVFRNLYSSHRITNNIEVYGGIITNKVWTWTWVYGSGATADGYNTTNSIYDSDVTFAPPPSFPNTGEYAFISWEEK